MSINQSRTLHCLLLIPNFSAGTVGKDSKRKPKEPPSLKLKHIYIQEVKGLAWDQLLVEARLLKSKLWSGVRPNTTTRIPTGISLKLPDWVDWNCNAPKWGLVNSVIFI